MPGRAGAVATHGLPVAGAPWRRLPVAPTPNTRGRLVCAKSSAVYHRQVALPSPWNRRGMLVCQADRTRQIERQTNRVGG